MRVGIATLAFACLLTATAATAQQPPAANHGAAVKPPAVDGTLGMALMSAVVNADGTLARGAGTTAAARLEAVGTYEVDFVRDVTACTYVAAIGDTGAGSTNGIAAVATRFGNNNGVFVETLNTGGSLTDLPFHLIVFCAQ